MSTMRRGPARAVADVTEGLIIATVDIAAPFERLAALLAPERATASR